MLSVTMLFWSKYRIKDKIPLDIPLFFKDKIIIKSKSEKILKIYNHLSLWINKINIFFNKYFIEILFFIYLSVCIFILGFQNSFIYLFICYLLTLIDITMILTILFYFLGIIILFFIDFLHISDNQDIPGQNKLWLTYLVSSVRIGWVKASLIFWGAAGSTAVSYDYYRKSNYPKETSPDGRMRKAIKDLYDLPGNKTAEEVDFFSIPANKNNLWYPGVPNEPDSDSYALVTSVENYKLFLKSQPILTQEERQIRKDRILKNMHEELQKSDSAKFRQIDDPETDYIDITEEF